jgi:hypothetical protein
MRTGPGREKRVPIAGAFAVTVGARPSRSRMGISTLRGILAADLLQMQLALIVGSTIHCDRAAELEAAAVCMD